MDATSRSVIREYHAGWTQKHFNRSSACLAPNAVFEVPINAYPNREAFSEALRQFGVLVTRVDLLAEFFDGNQGMLLYDMDVIGLGMLRVAEHFTVTEGKITRLRQIHDTAPVRAAGFAKDS